ncbi:MAG: efflux RND transporter permease subunit [Myxococcales bacterium]|nr:efflux RND transporter permease subunit [Myxococcales bacterium]
MKLLERLVRLSIRNSVFVNLFFIIVVVVGLIAAVGLPREEFPNVELGRVIVTTIYPGATATDVEELVTRPIEDALEDVSDKKRVRSRSQEGLSSITITFFAGTDLSEARAEVEQAVGTVNTLPEDAETPTARELEMELPVLSFALVGERGRVALIDRLADEFAEIPGVSRVLVEGDAERKFYVDVDESRLRALGLQPAVVAAAIRGARANVPAGTVEPGASDIFVKTDKRLKSVADVAQIPLQPGSPLRLGDIAEVRDVSEEGELLLEVEGRPAVMFTIFREDGKDPLRVYDEAMARLPGYRDSLPPGLELVITKDRTVAIRDRLETVLGNGVTGALLVVLVLWVMSGLRQAGLAVWGMPVSYLTAFYLMARVEISINVVSTFGLLIATGIIVDDAIVVIENVQRHLEMGKSRVQAALEGTREVIMPVTVAVLTTIFAFMPLALVGGTMGRVMKMLPIVVIFCLIGSLLEAILILPGHLAHFASTDAEDSRTSRLARRMKAYYRPALDFCLRRRWLVLVLALVAFVGTLGLAKSMRMQFAAPGKPFELMVQYELAPGVGRSQTFAQGEEIAAFLARRLPEGAIDATTIRAGSVNNERTGSVSNGANQGRVRVQLDVTDALLDVYDPVVRELRVWLIKNPDLFSYSIQEVEAGPPGGAGFTARLRSRDTQQLDDAVEAVKDVVSKWEGVVEIGDDRGSGKETFRVRVDQDRAALYGLTERDVGEAVKAALDGLIAAEVSIDEEFVEIIVRYSGTRRRTRGELLDLVIATPSGGTVRLDQVAALDRIREPSNIRREDGKRAIAVLGELNQKVLPALDASDKLQARWDREIGARYPDVELVFGGQTEELLESLNDLPASFAMAVGLIYIALALQFGSYVQPLVILCAVPFGIMGAILGLFSMGYDLSLFALFGIVGLAGIVVNDSLVMVAFINERRAEGASVQEAVLTGALDRLRPIVSTTLTTCFGLAPLAFGLGGLDHALAPMALSITAGLGFATALVLLVVPPLYLALDDLASALSGRRRAEARARERAEQQAAEDIEVDVEEERRSRFWRVPLPDEELDLVIGDDDDELELDDFE